MFVRSRMQKEVTYRKNGKEWTLKPGRVTLIEDSKVTSEELLKLYGTRIEIITRERLAMFEDRIPVKTEIKKLEVVKKEVKKEVKPEPVKASLKNEKLIDDILTRLTSEAKQEKNAGEIKKAEDLEIKEENNENAGKLKVEKDVVGDLVLNPVEDGKGGELVKNEEKKEESAAGEIKKTKEVKQRKPRAKKAEKATTPKKRTRKS